MPNAVPSAARRHFKAPSRSGDCLLDPPPREWNSIWQANLAGRTNAPSFLATLRTNARIEFLKFALHYTRQYRDVADKQFNADRVILSGHQPDLFHPGVWFKNFVLSRLGQQFSASAVQLIIDNDVYRQASIRIPTGSIAKPLVEQIHFDRIEFPVPFELAKISDHESFRSFAKRSAQSIRPFVDQPLVQQFWPQVLAEYQRVENVGRAIAAARHRTEADLGLSTLELPLSHVCRTEPFWKFAADVIERIDAFIGIYNRCLAEFRLSHKLRSRSHPVPDLEIGQCEFETPFWVWSKSSPVRRRLYVRQSGGEVILHDRHLLEFRIKTGESLAERLQQLDAEGVAIRPRAMMTTMYARIVLSDLFLHGIGGSVYDEVTDEIARQFFRIEPPRFLTLTATIHLPVSSPDVSRADVRRIDNDLRSLVYHPENYFDESNGTVHELIAAKRMWIDRVGPDINLSIRHQSIRDINQLLTTKLKSLADQLIQTRRKLTVELEHANILRSREFSFVLFPNALGEELHRLAVEATPG